MAIANTSPIFSGTPNVSSAQITSSTTALTASDGNGTVGTNIIKVFTSGASGSYLSKAVLQPFATAAATSTTATVIRLYLSTVGSGATTAANTWLIAEQAVSVQSAANSSTATYNITIPLNIAIPSGYFIHASIHAAPAANTAWQIIVYGGDYTIQS